MNRYCPIIIAFFFASSFSWSQELATNQIQTLIKSYKEDARGPYHRIKWFCENGTEREPKDPCPDEIGGGIQHASFKESALKLRKTNHLFFGEILAAEDQKAFLDKTNNFDRLKQYQIGKYLATIDDGWVLRKAQYYRGAIQSEDEAAWGEAFFKWLLNDDQLIHSNYYLLRQALKDIPHSGDSNLAQLMRSQSKILSEAHKPFMDLRIKIHGKPEASDMVLVESFLEQNNSKINKTLQSDFQELLKTMALYYAPIDFADLEKDIKSLSTKNQTVTDILKFINEDHKGESPEALLASMTNILHNIRLNITSFSKSEDRLKLLEISNQLEHALLTQVQKWNSETVYSSIEKISTLACAAMGTGLIESWEYNAIESKFSAALSNTNLSISQLNELLTTSRSVVEWSVSMVKANYQEEVDRYTTFEPLSYAFIDDRVRSSVALSLGETVSELGAYISHISNIKNEIMTIDNQSAVRGLNPGYAFGELVVVDGNPDAVEVNTNKIYIFEKPPHDLKPVAGIMTVSEGNLVSHVQLLARNLGIPNAALSDANLKELKKYSGKNVFYAVSNQGNVILKKEDDMSAIEKDLFAKKERNKNVIAVPVDQIKLDVSKVVNMRDVDASDSGKLCGPKAANLGELKKRFPNNVVEGLIIPFGIFRTHMDQQMPEQNMSYWQYLNDTFKKAKTMRSENMSENVVEDFQLKALDLLNKAIINMPLETTFVTDLKSSFKTTFGNVIGSVPVFLRSDTNMEDLKEFTGAGLNLTLFNIKDEDAIVNGIKRVWASAYTERSFKWRQKYLSNPENVFPSILIIPSVDVDYSGVMITKGINTGNEDDLTVAFSRGAGGAVDGQSAETRLITKKENLLLAPARQPDYIRLPENGGTKKYQTTFETPILNAGNVADIRTIADKIRKTMKGHSENADQAYDVEFGFKDNQLWLFQIRPFVENKQAKSSEYLMSISPKIEGDKMINLSEKIKL